jgi:hypothetical protein
MPLSGIRERTVDVTKSIKVNKRFEEGGICKDMERKHSMEHRLKVG